MKALLILCLATFLLQAQEIRDTKQLLVVTTDNWSTSSGSLQRYEREHEGWVEVGKAIEIKLGRNGLGWGIGLHEIPQEAKILKKEGDGKSPAGIFKLKQAFGYAPFKIRYPYSVYMETDHCVDDINSKYYNKIVDSTNLNKDYTSHERMKFPKEYYKYGVVVDHNGIAEGEISKKGAGSCIFIHIKSVPTAGCTVMSESEIKQVIRWLDPESTPLLLQGTKEVIESLWKNIK